MFTMFKLFLLLYFTDQTIFANKYNSTIWQSVKYLNKIIKLIESFYNSIYFIPINIGWNNNTHSKQINKNQILHETFCMRLNFMVYVIKGNMSQTLLMWDRDYKDVFQLSYTNFFRNFSA